MEMLTPIVSVWHREAEVPASEAASASRYDLPEHIFALAMIESELELREIQRQIFLAHIVVTTHDPAFDQTSEKDSIDPAHSATSTAMKS
jgi:hypothetical protein